MRMYSIKEAAARLGVHPDTIRRLVKRGEIQVERLSHQLVRIPESELAKIGLVAATPPSAAEAIAELRETVQRMEARIRELESRMVRQEAREHLINLIGID